MPARSPRRASPALQAVASPARQELLAVLGEGPATVREMSARLGRSRQALYYHLHVLEQAGIVAVAGWRGEGRERERVYRAAVRRVSAPARRGSAPDLEASERAVNAMLRLTAREVGWALRSGKLVCGGNLAMRGKAHLRPADLRRLGRLIRAIETLLQRTKQPGRGRELYAVTVILTPARSSHAVDSSSEDVR